MRLEHPNWQGEKKLSCYLTSKSKNCEMWLAEHVCISVRNWRSTVICAMIYSIVSVQSVLNRSLVLEKTAKYDHCIKIMFYINAWLVSSIVSIANYFLLYRNERHILAVVTFLWWPVCSFTLYWWRDKKKKRDEEEEEFGWLICGIKKVLWNNWLLISQVVQKWLFTTHESENKKCMFLIVNTVRQGYKL